VLHPYESEKVQTLVLLSVTRAGFARGGHSNGLISYARAEDRESGLAAGMNGYLTKPLVAQDLWETLALVTLGQGFTPIGADTAPPSTRATLPPTTPHAV
jgi:hypothetical protein